MNTQHVQSIFVALWLLSLPGCGTRNASADQTQPQPVTVRLAKPSHVRVAAEIDVSGTVETPAEPAKVGFQVSGKVIRVGPREGDFVKAGDVLAAIDPADYQFAVDSAAAQTALARAQYEKASASARPEIVEEARANLSQVEDEFRRMKTLYDNKSLAPNDFKKYETALTNAEQRYQQARQGAQREDKAAAKAALEQAEAAERIARKRLSDATLIAPAGGFIAKRNIEVGATAGPDASVFTIVELDPVEIQVGVPETDIRLVHQEVPNPKRTLLVGMIAEARILQNEKRDVLTLPGESVVRDPQGAPQVYVYFPADKKVYARRVKTGGITGQDVQISEGIKDDDLVVVAGQQLVREGSLVSAKEANQ